MATKTQQALLDRAERLVDREGGIFSFRSDEDRAEFDRLMDEANDDATPSDVEEPAPTRRRGSSYAVTSTDTAGEIDPATLDVPRVDDSGSSGLRRELLTEAAQSREAEGRAFPMFVANAEPVATYARFRVWLPAATERDLQAAVEAFNRAEFADSEQRRREAFINELDARREREEAGLTEQEQDDVDASLERARQAAERHDSVEGRLARVELLLERIAKGLEQR